MVVNGYTTIFYIILYEKRSNIMMRWFWRNHELTLPQLTDIIGSERVESMLHKVNKSCIGGIYEFDDIVCKVVA